MVERRLLLSLIGLLVGALLFPALSAAVGFGDPQPLASIPARVTVLSAASDGAGGTDVLASGVAGLSALHLGADGSVVRAPVATSSVWSSQLVRSTDGERIVVWAGLGGVQAASSEDGGVFGPAELLDAEQASLVQAVTAGDGTVVAAWDRYAIRRPGQQFGPAQPWPAGGDTSGGLALAGGQDGTIAAAWPAADHQSVLVSVRAPGAAAFGPAETAPGIKTVVRPAVVVLSKGTVVISGDGTSIVRRQPGGGYGAPEPIQGTTPGRPALALAPDGTLALVDDTGTVSIASAPPGGGFGPVRLLGGDDVGLPVRPLVWAGGTIAAFGTGTCCDTSSPIAYFYPGAGRGPLLVGGGISPSDAVAGATPGSLSAFVAFGNTLYRVDYPGEPDHRRARVSMAVDSGNLLRTVNPWTHAATVQIEADKAVRLSAAARIRLRGRWRKLHPRFRIADRLTGPSTALVGPFFAPSLRIPLPGIARACAAGRSWQVQVRVRVTDRAGDVLVRRLSFTARCH